MQTTVIEHPLAHEHLGRLAAEVQHPSLGSRATLRTLTTLLVAEVTRGMRETDSQPFGEGSTFAPLVVPLSPAGLEMVAMALPLFSDLDLAFVGLPADADPCSGLIWRRYLPATSQIGRQSWSTVR
jgi:uracil phosphoribosyltransferase